MKKLLIITGAGASLDFGMPSVKQIDFLMENWAKSLFLLANEPNKSLYTWVKEKLISQGRKNVDLDKSINFEIILYSLLNLSSLIKDSQYQIHTNTLKPFIHLNELPEIMDYKKRIKKADANDFTFLHSILIDNLLEYFRMKCKTLHSDKTLEIKELHRFFSSLKSHFKIGFFNLNYDNVILSTLPDLKTGFDKKSGIFKINELYNSDWNFCYHLHGSVHFDMSGDKYDMHKIFWNSNLASTFSQNSSGRSGISTSEGISHTNSSIVAGLDKTNQILKEPFRSYYMQLERRIYESDAILFIGYGFNDLYLNAAFPFIRYDKLKTRKIVVLDYADIGEDGLCFRSDDWSNGLWATIPYDSSWMGDGKLSIPFTVSDFKSKQTLEKSSNPSFPLAVWYDGLLSACKHETKILSELL